MAQFGAESCPPEFEEAAKKIAKNCRGLLLVFFKVVLELWQGEMTPEHWNKIAADEENSIFMVDNEISQIRKMKEDIQEIDDCAKSDYEIYSTVLKSPIITSRIKLGLFPTRFFPKMLIVSLVGMAGIGKTRLEKENFEDSSVSCCYEHHAWVRLGPRYQLKEIIVDILAEIYPDIDKTHMKGDAKLVKNLCAQLSDKRCLIVLDDIWEKEPLHHMKKFLPHIEGKVLVTTRLAKVAKFEEFDWVHEMRLLNKKESWDLFHKKVFGEEPISPELEKAGKKIVENCEGLPLLILTIANLLSKGEKTQEYWNKVAERQNSLFNDANNEIAEVLSPSYENLPQYLKPYFLYMGIFSQNHEISRSRLIRLWIAEGFLEPNPSQTVEDFATGCLLELVGRSLVMVRQKGSHFATKTFSLHSVFWHLSNNEAVKNQFFHALNTYADNPKQGLKSPRRLCIRNSILFGIKDVYKSMASISTAHSLICTDRPHQYPVPICLGLRLLRILDTLTIRFYEFPIEVLKLVQLRYLALTYNGGLPSSISKLWKLHFLIVRRHLSIKSGPKQDLPVEIWDMKELKHLQIIGSNLPNPNHDGPLLPNLLSFTDTNARSCTKRVLKRIHNLKRLGIQIELAPNDDGKSFHCLNRISRLRRLESLKCVVMNPELKLDIVAPPVPLSMFPLGLKKLSLSGLGYPWKHMSIIGRLKNLQALKLRCNAFRGPEWETEYYSFMELKFLSIEDTDLVHWKIKMMSFPILERLSIKHCCKLEELPTNLRNSSIVDMIEVVDCSPFVVAWAEQRQRQNQVFKLCIDSSWNAGNIKQ